MIEDKYPVTKGHTLIIPKRHFPNFFDISPDEMDDIETLLFIRKEELEATDKTIEGFNIGINIGEVAGQTVGHLHIHLIPRRKGDMDDPRGGVRGVIPEKQKY
jgi:ATP adenylyltransferase